MFSVASRRTNLKKRLVSPPFNLSWYKNPNPDSSNFRKNSSHEMCSSLPSPAVAGKVDAQQPRMFLIAVRLHRRRRSPAILLRHLRMTWRSVVILDSAVAIVVSFDQLPCLFVLWRVTEERRAGKYRGFLGVSPDARSTCVRIRRFPPGRRAIKSRRYGGVGGAPFARAIRQRAASRACTDRRRAATAPSRVHS